MTQRDTTQTPDTPVTVSLENVRYSRESRQVFENISLSLSERRIGIVGRNGSGKSQLARLIAGLACPDEGVVTVNGVTVARDRQAALRTVGILFQNPDHQIIFPTIGEELEFGLNALGRDPHQAQVEAHQMLARFDRADWYERSVHELSQGQRHLVCLMAVLAMAPSLIVLDEPFAGLDLATSLRLQRYLDGLAPALVHITHDLPSLENYDRVIWLERGEIRMDGTADEVVPAYEKSMRAKGAQDDFTDL
ncbi:MAG: ABC transporter ATP-binding protein [Thalassovita sp.]